MEPRELSMTDLFPPGPISKNPLEDVFTRFMDLPVYYRKKLCDATGWNQLQYFRKIRAGTISVNDIINPALNKEEAQQTIDTTITVLKMFLAYMETTYKNA